MTDLDTFTDILNALVEALPPAVLKGLNLGVGVVEGHKFNPKSRPDRPLYIMGEYHRHPVMGRGILLYYGSFERVFPAPADENTLRQRIHSVLAHEITHHLEGMAGARDLEIADATRLRGWIEE